MYDGRWFRLVQQPVLSRKEEFQRQGLQESTIWRSGLLQRAALLLPLSPSLIHCLPHTSSSVTIAVYTHAHTLIITLHYSCCYDEIEGVQDLESYSHAHSLDDSLPHSDLWLAPDACCLCIRYTHVNAGFELCETYPEFIVVPNKLNDTTIRGL